MTAIFRAAILLASLVLLLGPEPLHAREPSARQLYKTGRKYEKAKDFANAYLYYSKAAAADPLKRSYWQRAQALQRKAISSAGVLPLSSATALPSNSGELPSLPAASQGELREARSPQPPVDLKAEPVERDFDLRADGQSLWEQVMKAYGLDIVFDGDFQPGPVQRFHITDADYRNALHALMTATGTFIVPISNRLIMVVKDTETKRREVENTIAVAIPIPEPFSLQEAQELGRSVQQLMEIQRFAIDSAQRVAIMRDRVSKVRPAQILFEQLMHGRAQVAIEVDLLAFARSRLTSLGIGVPTSLPIVPLIRTITLGGGPLSFGLAIGGANVIASATKGDSTILYRSLVRSVDGQTAQLLVGQKYPIQTVAYIGTVPEGEQSFTPPPSFNFEDLGFNLKLTPKVHDRKEMTLQIEAEFKLLGAGSLNGIPIISSRRFATQARVRFGEAAIISGLVTQNDVTTMSGPAGLLSVPVLGTLLGATTRAHDTVDVLLVMRPVLLSDPGSEMVTRDIWIGSEGRPRIPM